MQVTHSDAQDSNRRAEMDAGLEWLLCLAGSLQAWQREPERVEPLTRRENTVLQLRPEHRADESNAA